MSGLFLVVLCVENCASMLARRYAVGVRHVHFSKNSVLCMNELIKMLWCLGMETSRKGTARMAPHLVDVVRRSGLMFVPGVCARHQLSTSPSPFSLVRPAAPLVPQDGAFESSRGSGLGLRAPPLASSPPAARRAAR